ncbi:MAG TPA: hypothetical protein VN956_20795 [Pyrinomonadaceae bacterium]|nr:hypothetical protein [Pyrinomonadaceae bacterium]
MAGRGWKRRLDDPTPLPRGRYLVTLEDAGNYITRLPKTEHEAQEWQAAMEALILVATSGGPTMFARIGVMRALNRHVERVFNPDLRRKITVFRNQRGLRRRSWLLDESSSRTYPGAIMTTLQAILLGVMLAWTPSLVVLAVLLRDIRDLEESEEFGRGPS